jgi:hypothetical protein
LQWQATIAPKIERPETSATYKTFHMLGLAELTEFGLDSTTKETICQFVISSNSLREPEES